MKFKLSMYIDVDDNWLERMHFSSEQLERYVKHAISHLDDDVLDHTDWAFKGCDVIDSKRILDTFTEDLRRVRCLESFNACQTNVVNGKKARSMHGFEEGKVYDCCSWRPEGMTIDNHFVFNKYANKFTKWN